MHHISRDRLLSILIISPSVVLIGIFVYGFIAFTGYSSLSKWDALTPDFTFVGLRNYQKLTIDRFMADLRNTVTFTLLFLGACLVIGLFLAILLDQRVKGEGVFRSIFLFPMAISYIVTGVVWRWLLNPGTAQTGSSGVNLLFEKIGLPFLRWGWFTDPDIVRILPESAVGQLRPRRARRAHQPIRRHLTGHDFGRARRHLADVRLHHGDVSGRAARHPR